MLRRTRWNPPWAVSLHRWLGNAPLAPCLLSLVLLAGLVGTPQVARASTIASTFLSFTGSLATSSTDFEQSFSLSAPSTLTIQTWGFGGGTNAAGTLIPAGGFDSLVALYSGMGPSASIVLSGGNPAASADTLSIFAPNCPPAGMVTIGAGAGSSVCGDNNLVLATLAAGTYTLQLTDANYIPQAVNPGPPGASLISDGFTDLTGGVFQTCNTTTDGTTTCITPTSNYAVDIVAPTAVLTAVPEPGSLMLLLGGITMVSWRRRAKS